MELRQLEHVLAVVEEGQFTKAASRVHIAQSGLSSSIRSLERELGVALFARTTRRVALTEAGQSFVGEARKVIAAAEAARASVGGMRDLGRGTLLVNAAPSVEVWFDLTRLLGEFRERHSAVDARVTFTDGITALDQVSEHLVDVAVTAIPAKKPNNLHTLVLAESQFVIACPTNHALARRRSVTLRALHDEPFVDLAIGSMGRGLTDQLFDSTGLARNVTVEVHDIPLMLRCVSGGLGIACLPRPPHPVERDIALLSVSPYKGWSLAMVTDHLDQASPAARALVELAEARTTMLRVS